jgi:hypothetical protein
MSIYLLRFSAMTKQYYYTLTSVGMSLLNQVTAGMPLKISNILAIQKIVPIRAKKNSDLPTGAVGLTPATGQLPLQYNL